jgi:DNA-directed RNA polymerase subunit RPC12/RpoP
MSYTVVPEKHKYTCDSCGYTIENDQLYKDHRPPNWLKFVVYQTRATDFQGIEWSDGTLPRLVCQPCGKSVIETLHKIGKGRL